MKQCENCTKQKRADNCIKCAQEWKGEALRAEEVIDQVQKLIFDSPRYELQNRLKEYFGPTHE